MSTLKYFKNYKKEVILAPTLKLLEALFELFIPIILANIINKGINNNDTHYIVAMTLLMILCGVIGLAFSVLAQYFAAKAAVYYCKDLKSALFEKIESLTYSDIDELGVSQVITRMTSDIDRIQTGINLALRLLLRSPFIVFGACICATIIAPSIAYIFWICVPILAIIVFVIMLVSIKGQKKVQENLDKVLGLTRDNLSGVRVIRALSKEDDEIDHYYTEIDHLEKKQNIVGMISNILNPLTYVIINLSIVVLIYLGYIKVESGIYDTSVIIALYGYMSQILVELIKLANLIITITRSIASLNRIKYIMEMDNTINIIGSSEEVSNKAYIEFDKVEIKYHEDSKPALENISFKVNKGELIGIIGGTGSGKSSLIGLLNRYYETTKGEIYFDGKNIQSYDPTILRDRIGIVNQNSVLFKGTIKDNLLYSSNSDEKYLDEAIRVSQSEVIINKKEAGIDSIVEQDGRNFSGGEKQRLAIARILAKRPEVLILDDSSSALDYLTDLNLRRGIKNLSYHPTTFIISQRTTSIEDADKIIVLDNGQIVGTGTHDELLKNNKLYQEIYYANHQEVSHE